MISCFVTGCRWKNTCPSLFGIHLRRVHEPIDVYSCNFSNCERRFSVRCSYISHIKKHIRYNDVGANSNCNPVRLDLEDRVSPSVTDHNFSNENVSIELHRENFEEYQLTEEKNIEAQQIINLEKLLSEISRLNIGLNLKWLNKDAVPRNLVFQFQDDVRSNVLEPLNEIIKVMADTGLISPAGSDLLRSAFSVINNSQTEYKFMRELKKVGLFEEPVYFTISNEIKPAVIHQNLEMVEDIVKGVLMPIKFQLRKYLESGNILDMLIECLKPSDDGVIRSLIDGTIWQEKIQGHENKMVVPINVFIDDFTTSDTVSPHSSNTKLCGIYCYIPCLPPYLLSQLANILTTGYVMSADRKRFGNERTLHKLVEVLSELENTGVTVTHKGNELIVYFKLGFMTGDNLGLSEILNLVESPSANYYCRVCTRPRNERETDCKEYEDALRSITMYEDHLKIDDVSKTGIKEDCILNRIPSFHVALNVYFDVMHDVPEGICRLITLLELFRIQKAILFIGRLKLPEKSFCLWSPKFIQYSR